MPKDSFLLHLRCNAYISLGSCYGTVLQELLDEDYVVIIIVVDICGIEFSEAMCPYIFKS